MNRERFDAIFKSVYIVQDADEFFWLVNHVEQLSRLRRDWICINGPECIIEIGVERGGSLKFWEQILPEHGLLIGVDEQHPTDFIGWNWKNSNREIHIIEGHSEDPTTIEEVKRALNGREADFLFIDATHTYEAVCRDFANYSCFVRVGGAVGFHDLGDVLRFWKTLPGRKEEMVKSIGTGVWFKP